MSIDLNDPCRSSLIGKKEENEIRAIFYQHWERIKNQISATINGINKWRSESIQHINSYADAEIRKLEADYNQQRAIFDKKREDNIETAKAYHRTKKNDLFKELCNACRSLQFQVARLEFIRDENNHPKVITVAEQTRAQEQENTNTRISEYEIVNLWPMTTSTSSDGGNRSAPSNTNNSIACTTIQDDSNSKCPICFMIFPLSMASNDRHRHVDGHMLDGQGTHNIAT